MKILPLSNARIAYEDVGQGPPVIFAHGLSGNLLSWWQQASLLSNRFRCIAFSHRGFYGSENLAGHFDVSTMIEDIIALADNLGLSRFALVAQSMSGWPAIEIALDYRPRLTALVLCSTSGTVNPISADPEAMVNWTRWSANMFANAGGLAQMVTDLALHERHPELDYLYARLMALPAHADVTAIRKTLKETQRREVSVLSSIRVPTLWLGGTRDAYFPSLVLPALASRTPTSELYLFEGCGHSPYFENARVFNDVVSQFLARHV